MLEQCHCSCTCSEALAKAIASFLTDPETAAPAEYNPFEGRLFISFKRFCHIFDAGETHGRELLKGLDPPVRRSGRRSHIPVLGILRLAESLPIGFGQEPEPARRGREARLRHKSDGRGGDLSEETNLREPTGERVPKQNLAEAAGHQPAPPTPSGSGSHQGQPERGSKKSAKTGMRDAAP